MTRTTLTPSACRIALFTVNLTVTMTMAACGGDGAGSAWAGAVDTLSNGAVHVTNPAQGVWSEEERWRLDLELRIGALESGGPDQFGAVVDVEVDGRGRIYVLERQASEVRVFDAEGAHVRTFGGPGGGPGELGQPLSMGWGPGGNLWVVDFGNRRYQVFDTAGSAIATHPFQGTMFGFGNELGSDGLLYEMAIVPEEEPRQIVVRRSLPADATQDLGVVDTLIRPDPPDGKQIDVAATVGENTFNVTVSVPLEPRGLRALVPGRGWWLSDATPRYRVALTDLQGDTLLVAEREYEPVEATLEDREEALDVLPDGADLAPEDLPDAHPAMQALEPAPEGRLWVRRQVAVGREGFDVFDSDGRYLGELATEIPVDRFRLHTFDGDAVYGVLLDDLDVPYVVRLHIRRPGGGSPP